MSNFVQDAATEEKGQEVLPLNTDVLVILLDFCDILDLANCAICGINVVETMLRPNSLIWKRIKENRAGYDVYFGQRMRMELSAMDHCLKVGRREYACSFATICDRSIYKEWVKMYGTEEISVIVTGNRSSGVTSVAESLRYVKPLGLRERARWGVRLLCRFVIFRSENDLEFPIQIKYKHIRGDCRFCSIAFREYQGRYSIVAVFSVTDRYALRRLGELFNITIKKTRMKKGLFQSVAKVILANKCDLPESEHVISRSDAKTFAAQYSATLIWGSALTGWNMKAVYIHALGPQFHKMLVKTRNGLLP